MQAYASRVLLRGKASLMNSGHHDMREICSMMRSVTLLCSSPAGALAPAFCLTSSRSGPRWKSGLPLCVQAAWSCQQSLPRSAAPALLERVLPGIILAGKEEAFQLLQSSYKIACNVRKGLLNGTRRCQACINIHIAARTELKLAIALT